MVFRFHFDVRYLQLPRVFALRERLTIEARPVVLGALRAHHGQLGPAGIPGKREFTCRFVPWQAERGGIVLRFPPAHSVQSACGAALLRGGRIAVGSGRRDLRSPLA